MGGTAAENHGTTPNNTATTVTPEKRPDTCTTTPTQGRPHGKIPPLEDPIFGEIGPTTILIANGQQPTPPTNTTNLNFNSELLGTNEFQPALPGGIQTPETDTEIFPITNGNQTTPGDDIEEISIFDDEEQNAIFEPPHLSP